MSIQEHNS